MSENLPAHRQPQYPTIQTDSNNDQEQHDLFVDQYIDLFSKRLKQSSESIEDFIELGNLFRQKKKYKKAFVLHRNLLVRPNITKEQKSAVYAEMGYDYLHSSTKDYGQKYFDESLKLFRKNPYALEGLFQSYRKQKKFQQAIETLEELIRFSPEKKKEFHTLYCEMVMLSIHNNDVMSAKKWHKKAQEFGRTPFLLLTSIQIAMAQDNYEHAIEGITKMVMEYPEHSFFPIQKLEDLLYDTGQYSEYFQILTRCNQKSPNHPFVNHALAKYYEKTSQYEKAKEFYLKAMDEHPSSIQIFKDASSFFHKQKDQDMMPSIEGFLQSLTTDKFYTCQSCLREFSSIPKNCKVCRGWNLFDVKYVVKHQ